MTDSSWNPDTSTAFLTYFKGTVLDAFWSSPAGQALKEGRDAPDYDGADRTAQYWHVNVDEILDPGYDGDQESITFPISVGSGWWADESGLLVTHEDDTPDKLKGFKSSTRYGQLLGLIMGAEDEYRDVDKTDDFGPIDYDFKGAAAYIKSTGKSSRDATVWQGTSWVFRGVATIMRRQGTSEARLLRDARLRIVPVMFLGANGEVQDKGSSKGAAAVASTPNSTAPISAEAVADTLPPGTDPALVENLVRLLGVSSSHTEFMRNAVGLEGVKGDNDVTARVMDEADGPWSVKAGSKAGN